MRGLLFSIALSMFVQPAIAFDSSAVINCFNSIPIDEHREKCVAPTLKCDDAEDAPQCSSEIEEQWFRLGMQYFRMGGPIARALNDLRVAADCKENERCLGFSFVNLGSPPRNMRFLINLSEEKEEISENCKVKHAGSSAGVAKCSAERIAISAALNVQFVLGDLKLLNEELQVLFP